MTVTGLLDGSSGGDVSKEAAALIRAAKRQADDLRHVTAGAEQRRVGTSVEMMRSGDA